MALRLIEMIVPAESAHAVARVPDSPDVVAR